MRSRPSLRNDRSFWGIILTQFLGAFNDNLFKMLLLLICVDYVADRAGAQESTYFDPYQTWASLLFATAFIAFSGLAGFLADRHPKRFIIVGSKMAETGVMLLGFFVFLLGSLGTFSFIMALFAVLFLMGMQSAFFGPSKYGIFPEVFDESDLPMANGIAQATTFLSVIFGMALAGWLKLYLADDLWLISLLCVGIAVAGTATSLAIRSVPAAQPGLTFSASCFFLEGSVWRQIIADRALFRSLLVYSFFWFTGGVVVLAVTIVGKLQMQVGDGITAVFNATMGLGIGTGCVLAAKMSHHKIRFSLVDKGAWGLMLGLGLASVVAVLPMNLSLRCWLFALSLFIGGFFAGWIAVPLQVFIQVEPPAALKGRVIAAMNLITWIGILSASIYYFCFLWATGFTADPSWMLVSVGLIVLVANLWLRPGNAVRDRGTREQ